MKHHKYDKYDYYYTQISLTDHIEPSRSFSFEISEDFRVLRFSLVTQFYDSDSQSIIHAIFAVLEISNHLSARINNQCWTSYLGSQ